ncbi:MAG: UvrB/UvrC motif-containing protein, partial [Desulfobacterales bacterium]
ELANKSEDKISDKIAQYESVEDIDVIIRNLEKEMKQAADELAFEKAAELRDQIQAIKKLIVFEI